jgi:hypothetical protein
MASGLSVAEWPTIMGITPDAHTGLAVLTLAIVIGGWACWRRIACLNAVNRALDERLRLAQNSQAEAIQKLTIAEARFQELHTRIKASDGFVSLLSSAGGVARSMSDVGNAQQQLAATLAWNDVGASHEAY